MQKHWHKNKAENQIIKMSMSGEVSKQQMFKIMTRKLNFMHSIIGSNNNKFTYSFH